MPNDSIVMIGAPESGKTNYLGRLWGALQDEKTNMRATQQPDDIRYVFYALSFLLQGEFPPRTQKSVDVDERHCLIPVAWEHKGKTRRAELLIPDVSGEIWEESVLTNELPEAWMKSVRRSIGALLFIRVGSSLNRPSLNWVATQELLEIAGEADEGQHRGFQITTDVQLCEFLRFLELALGKDADVDRPRVAVLVAAWDLVDEERAQQGPRAYLEKEYPLFAGRLTDVSTLEVAAFGVSVVGGDFADPEFKTRYFEKSIEECGYVVADSDVVQQDDGVTTPVRWVLDAKARR